MARVVFRNVRAVSRWDGPQRHFEARAELHINRLPPLRLEVSVKVWRWTAFLHVWDRSIQKARQ